MYQQFFGFQTLPFKITPDERVFFAGAHRQEMLDALLYGIERGEGLITVIGEVGIGKTTLARVLSNRFSDSFSMISVFTPNVSPLEILRLIAHEAGIEVSEAAGKGEIMRLIRDYCLNLHRQGKRFLLIIDEAQTMLVDTIEELRLLSNMQVDDVKLVQVLLFGQPELDRMLNSPQLRQVKDRVVFQIHIEPLTRDELAQYLEFRLQQAGFKGQHFFSSAVVDAIYKKTQGYPRAVNRLADQALMAAFAEQTHQVQVAHVESSNQEAIQPLQEMAPVPSRLIFSGWFASFFQRPVIGAMVLVGALSLSWLWWWTNLPLSASSEPLTQSAPAAVSETPVNKPDQASTSETPALTSASVPEASTATPLASEATQVTTYDANPLEQRDIQNPTEWSRLPVIQPNSSNEAWRALHQAQLRLFSQYAQQEKYTIQLMSSPWRLRTAFVEEVSTIITALPKEPSFYYDYSMTADRPRIAAIYGVYESKELAHQAWRSLIAMNKGYRPEMTSFKQVLAMMQASQVLTEAP